MNIELSIIIVNYNTFELTCACIRSIKTFTKSVRYEIILVDNASTEVDPEQFLLRFPDIILIKSGANNGFAKGNNAGLEYAQGQTVLLLNSDTEIHADVIGGVWNQLQKMQPEVGVITVRLDYPDGRVQHSCGKFPSIRLQLIELFRIQKLYTQTRREELLLGGFFKHDRPVYPDWTWGTFFMFRKEVLKSFKNNKLSDRYFMYQEDLEWSYLIRKNGFKIYFDPSFSIVHHFSASSNKNSLIRRKNKNLTDNLKDFVCRYKGKTYAFLYFMLLRLNLFFTRNG
jgi:GT2 family glycosyltransferase